MDIVQKFGKDVPVPKNPESEGSRLINLRQIEQEHGVSRSALHTYRRSTSFPQPVSVEGSTKVQYRAEEVAAWFEANPPSQGRRTDLPDKQQGEPAVAEVQVGPQPPSDKDARKQIRDILLLHGWQAEQVDPWLDAYAHQLAERARAGVTQFEEHVGGFQYSREMREIIDVVDPTVPDPEGWGF